jgi:hypothetical protein
MQCRVRSASHAVSVSVDPSTAVHWYDKLLLRAHGVWMYPPEPREGSFARCTNILYVIVVREILRYCRRNGGRRSCRACYSLSAPSVHAPCSIRAIEHTLELALPQGWSVASDDDELSLAGAQSLESGLVAESDLARLWKESVCGLHCTQPAVHRTLIVSASFALMLSAALVFFLGAMASVVSST